MALININQNHLIFAFGLLGNIISFLVYLAPLPTFYRIYKNKSTGEFQSLPYLVALFSSMLWLYYGLLKPDAAALITINSFGCFVELIYIIMYITYAAKGARNSAIRLFAGMNVVCFAIILLVTQFALHNAVLRVQVLGWICVSISVSVFAAPLSIVAQVIRTKSVRYMPFNLSFSLTLSAIIWFFYGLFLKDICIALPNVAGFILGILQMLLYAVYRNGDAKKKVVKKENEQELETDVIKEKENENENENEKEETTVINIVVVNTLGSCEVYPIPVDANGDVLSNEQLQGTKDAKETEKSVEAN